MAEGYLLLTMHRTPLSKQCRTLRLRPRRSHQMTLLCWQAAWGDICHTLEDGGGRGAGQMFVSPVHDVVITVRLATGFSPDPHFNKSASEDSDTHDMKCDRGSRYVYEPCSKTPNLLPKRRRFWGISSPRQALDMRGLEAIPKQHANVAYQETRKDTNVCLYLSPKRGE